MWASEGSAVALSVQLHWSVDLSVTALAALDFAGPHIYNHTKYQATSRISVLCPGDLGLVWSWTLDWGLSIECTFFVRYSYITNVFYSRFPLVIHDVPKQHNICAFL